MEQSEMDALGDEVYEAIKKSAELAVAGIRATEPERELDGGDTEEFAQIAAIAFMTSAARERRLRTAG